MAHGRGLLPFEEDLASGIAGQIRNQVTIFMSDQDPVGDIYPRIEWAADSFGRRIESSSADHEIAGAVRDYAVLLHPGDVVSFTCVRTDPQGRDLEWELGPNHGSGLRAVEASGVPTKISWSVTDGQVTERATVVMYMRTYEAKYYRFGNFDHRAHFTYRIRPPST